VLPVREQDYIIPKKIPTMKNAFFVIMLLGIGQVLMSATTPFQVSSFDWSKAYASHYSTTGYGVMLAKIKKDTDKTDAEKKAEAEKKKKEAEKKVETGAVKGGVAAKAKMFEQNKQVAPKPVLSPKKKSSQYESTSSVLGGAAATTQNKSQYESASSALGGFSNTPLPSTGNKVPVTQPNAMGKISDVKKPTPPAPVPRPNQQQSHTASTSSNPVKRVPVTQPNAMGKISDVKKPTPPAPVPRPNQQQSQTTSTSTKKIGAPVKGGAIKAPVFDPAAAIAKSKPLPHTQPAPKKKVNSKSPSPRRKKH